MGALVNPNTPLPQFGDSDLPFAPTVLRQGDSWNWQTAFPDFPSALYQLQLIFNSANNRFLLDGTLTQNAPITAADDSQSFLVQATATQTGSCQPDQYQIVAVLIGIGGTTAAGQQVTLELQSVNVQPNLAGALGPVDTRSFVKKRLDMIEAAISGDTRPDVQEYVINGRQIRKISPLELEKLRTYYRAQYRAELRAKGEYASPRTIGFRFKPSAS